MSESAGDDLFRSLFLSEEPARADVILVLGSSDPAEAARRARRGAELYAAGYAPRVLVSGGNPAGRGASEAAAMAAEAVRRGVPPAAVLAEPDSHTTAENVLLSRDLLAREGLLAGARGVLLVSSWWHLRRARALAAAVLGPGVRVTCCAAEVGPDPAGWARGPEGRRVLACERELLAALGVETGAAPDPAQVTAPVTPSRHDGPGG